MSPAPVPSPDTPPQPYRFFVEAVLFLSYVVFGLSWIGYAPFLPDYQSRFGLSYAQTSLLISSVSFSKIFMPFVAGWLALRLGVGRAASLGLLLICAGVWVPLAGSYPEVLAARFVFGLGGAVLVTLIGSLVMQWFPKSELAVVNGFNYVAVNTGISASLFITLPLAGAFGSRNTLLGYALVSVLLTLAWIVWGKERHATRAAANPDGSESYASVLRSKETWFLALGFAGPLALYLSLNTWLPSFYAQSMGMTKAESARLTGLFNLAGIPAAIIGGVITKTTTRRKPMIWIPALVMGASAFGLFLLRDQTLLFACAVLFGISLFLWISPLTTLAMELPGMTPPRLAMVMGVFYSVSYIFAFFAPLIVGALRDRTGSFVPGFMIFAVASWSLALFGSLLPETGKVNSAPARTS